MNINWKARLTSKEWWGGIIALVILFSQQCGFDLTAYIPKDYASIFNTLFLILGALGITTDTSTPTLSDQVVSKVTKNIVQATNAEETVKTDPGATVNNVIDTISASSKVTVDNPDNLQSIGATVNVTNAVSPQ